MSKVALVTGGTRGIGAAISLALKKEGCNVAATYSSNSDAANKFSSENGIDVFQWNVADAAACEAGVKQVEEKLGSVDILVNNAGITKDQLFMRMKDEDWDDVIETNLNGLFRVTKAFIKPMVKNKFGRVINISSVAGLMGNSGQVNYSSSKSAMVGFSRSLAKELGSRNITSNVIAPGFIETDMTTFLNDDEKVEVSKNIPMKRFGTVEDVAKCILFLASDEANYITGQTISVDGGLFMY